MKEKNNHTILVEKRIREYLKSVIHLSLATAVENKPWITEVHYSYDNDLNFYFLSRPSRRHSSESQKNHLIAGNIVKQHWIWEKVAWVYFEWIIEMLENISVSDTAYTTYHDRFSIGPEKLKEQYEENGHRFFKIKVLKFSIFD